MIGCHALHDSHGTRFRDAVSLTTQTIYLSGSKCSPSAPTAAKSISGSSTTTTCWTRTPRCRCHMRSTTTTARRWMQCRIHSAALPHLATTVILNHLGKTRSPTPLLRWRAPLLHALLFMRFERAQWKRSQFWLTMLDGGWRMAESGQSGSRVRQGCTTPRGVG